MMRSYLTLVPRGLEHLVQEMVREQLVLLSSSSSQEQYAVKLRVIGEATALPAGTGSMETVARLREQISHLTKKVGHNNKRKRQESVLAATSDVPVGTIFQEQSKRYVSTGYYYYDSPSHNKNGLATATNNQERVDVWTTPGHLPGVIWLQISTNAPLELVTRLRCLGPLLALVQHNANDGDNDDDDASVQLGESVTLKQAIVEIGCAIRRCNSSTVRQEVGPVDAPSYEQSFATALELWIECVQSTWNLSPDQMSALMKRYQDYKGQVLTRRRNKISTLPNSREKTTTAGSTASDLLRFRLSCLRDDSRKYSYARQDLLRDLADVLVPHDDLLRVDLVQYDMEVVLLMRPHALAIAVNLRPYQHLGARSFAAGTIPPDVHAPYQQQQQQHQSDMEAVVRLRPTTARILLHLANIQPGDVVLDPLVGTGTIAMECSLLTVPTVAWGGDLAITVDSLVPAASKYARQVVQTAKETKEKSTVPSALFFPTIELTAWDACLLPLRSESVDVIVSDLPFGQQCLSAAKLQSILPLILGEMARVLRRQSGRAVLLCGAHVAVLEALQACNDATATSTEATNNDENVDSCTCWQFPCTGIFPVNIGGLLAWVIVVQRGGSVAGPIPNHEQRFRKLVKKQERSHELNKNGNAKGKKRKRH